MTAIAGAVHEGQVWIGGDSAGVDGDFSLTVRADEKVWRNGELVFGICGSFRMGNLLRYSLSLPTPDPKCNLDKWMVNIFIERVRKCLSDGGHTHKNNNEESIGGSFLVGLRGRLYEVQADLQLGKHRDGYAGIGCGGGVALGSLYATRDWSDQRKRILTALSAAERHSGGVRRPFLVQGPLVELRRGRV